MKRTNLIGMFTMIVMMAFTTTATAQFDSKAIGFTYQKSSNFDFFYTKQKNAIKFRRYKIGSANGSIHTFGSGATAVTGGVDLAVGYIKRRPITKRVGFVHGFEPGAFTAYTNHAGNKSFVFTPRLGYILGADVKLTKRINVGVEVVPSAYMAQTFTNNESGQNTYRNFGLNRGRMALTASYKFKK